MRRAKWSSGYKRRADCRSDALPILPVAAAAAKKLATRLIAARSLRPPIDVQALLAEVADVEEIAWPQRGVDAVVVRLDQPRPQVMLRADASEHRKRFTMAHELRHILVPWHV